MMLVQADLSFVKLIEYSDIIVRPTCTNGDPLTVREALYLGKPAVASDVVSRPEETTPFKNRDYMDMANAIMSVIDSPRQISASANNLDEYRSFYTEIYGDS